jgi:hypothetical protein
MKRDRRHETRITQLEVDLANLRRDLIDMGIIVNKVTAWYASKPWWKFWV